MPDRREHRRGGRDDHTLELLAAVSEISFTKNETPSAATLPASSPRPRVTSSPTRSPPPAAITELMALAAPAAAAVAAAIAELEALAAAARG